MNDSVVVVDRWKKLLQNVLGVEFQARSVDARMTPDEGVVIDHILINEKTHPVVMVIHEAKYTDGARRDIQKFFHEIRCCKGKAGTSDLFGKLCCFKLLVPRHHEQIKLGLLGIAQEQIFADLDIQPDIHVILHFKRIIT